MKKKILFSTKFCANDSSDVVGGSLAQILFAEFYKKNFNYQIDLFDPFYNTEKILKKFCDNVYSTLPNNIENYDKIINPLFYVSNLKKQNGKLLNVEGASLQKKKEIVFSRVSNLSIQQKRHGLYSLINPYSSNSYNHKTLDIPYLYYYEWLARENFVSNLKLKNSIKIPVSQKQNIYSIHIRYLDKKKTHLSETSVKKENYYDLIFNIIKKIRNEDKKSSIIFYGIEPNSTKIIDKLLNLDCIHLEQYSSNPLERALLLSCNNISIASVNGSQIFRIFYLSHKKSLKEK